MGLATTVPLRSRPGTRTVPVGVPERTGVALVEVSVEVSASVSLLIVDGVSEIGGVIETGIIGDSWMIPSSVGAGTSVDTSAIWASCTRSLSM